MEERVCRNVKKTQVALRGKLEESYKEKRLKRGHPIKPFLKMYGSYTIQCKSKAFAFQEYRSGSHHLKLQRRREGDHIRRSALRNCRRITSPANFPNAEFLPRSDDQRLFPAAPSKRACNRAECDYSFYCLPFLECDPAYWVFGPGGYPSHETVVFLFFSFFALRL